MRREKMQMSSTYHVAVAFKAAENLSIDSLTNKVSKELNSIIS